MLIFITNLAFALWTDGNRGRKLIEIAVCRNFRMNTGFQLTA